MSRLDALPGDVAAVTATAAAICGTAAALTLAAWIVTDDLVLGRVMLASLVLAVAFGTLHLWSTRHREVTRA